MFSLKGSIAALVTPFAEDGSVDYGCFADLVAWHIAAGTDAIVVCGTTGEAPTLTEEEQRLLFQTAVKASKGRIPVIAGTGTYCTHKSVKKTEEALKIGADAALVVVPYYSRPTPEGCFAHYRELSKVGLPIIVYHHPGRTGISLSPKTLAEICSLPNIAGVKEASGTPEITSKLFQILPDAAILSGDDTAGLELMQAGAQGIISIVANLIPEEWKRFVDLALQRKWEEAEKLFEELREIYTAMVLETNPQCIKYALSLIGKCSSRMRLPLLEPRSATQEKIKRAIQQKIISCSKNEL